MIQVSPYDSELYSGLLSDREGGRYLSDKAQLKAMLKVEGELALAQAEAGLIPTEAADAISRAANLLDIEPMKLAAGTASAGVPVPALVRALKNTLSGETARWVHFGATSQDIVDTALILNCKALIALFEGRLRSVAGLLVRLMEQYRDTLIAGRTRTQQAVPMSLGLKIAAWLGPLLRHQERLRELKPRLLKPQLGGAVGSLAAMGSDADKVARHFARRLGLSYASSWHSQRDSLVELSNWLALTTGTLGKMAEDWLRLAQTEVGELRFRNGGGSSTMPQKCNPVSAEILVALARQNAGLAGQMQQTMLHEHERGGSSWAQEWLILPQMLMTAGVALRHGEEGLNHLEIVPERIEANLNSNHGLIYAEAATFALTENMPRDEATQAVSQACQRALGSDSHLFDVLAELTGHTLDLQQIQRDLLAGGATRAWLDDLLERARATFDI